MGDELKDYIIDSIKSAFKEVGKKIWAAIRPYLPWIIGIGLLIIVIVGCIPWEDVMVTASAEGMTSASTSSWEQFKRFVLLNEGGTRVNEAGEEDENGAYYIVEDDWYGNPTVGHGLCLYNPKEKSYPNKAVFAEEPYNINTSELVEAYYNAVKNGYDSKNREHYKYFPKVSAEICDAIWDKALRAKYEAVKAACSGLDLTEYQLYALTDVKYRRGHINYTNKSGETDSFVNAYNQLWNDSQNSYKEDPSDEAYSMDSLYSFFNNGRAPGDGVYSRKQRQWILFKYGYYEGLGEYYTATDSSSIVQAAEELHNAQIDWTYSIYTLIGGNIELSINSPYRTTCCATFVSSVLYKAGYVSELEINSISYNSSNALYNFLTKIKGWEEIKSYDQLQSGDVVFMDTDGGERDISHVQLYVGDGETDLWYNAGSTEYIQKKDSPYELNCSNSFYVAVRPQ